MRIGFVGLGNIGGSCARRLVDAGHDVTVVDPDGAARARLVEAGASAAPTPAALAGSVEAVILSLPTPDVSVAVVTGADGVLAGAADGLVVVDLSTNALATTRALHDACAERGVEFIDCPVSGGSWAADAGDLALMPSGNPAAWERVGSAMAAFGKDDTVLLGPSGTGTLVKLINNQIFLVGSQVFMEGYLMAAKAGLDIGDFMSVLRASSGAMFAPLADLVIRRQWDDSTYDLRLAEKDLRLALESAAEIGTPMPLTNAAREVLARSVEAGLGHKWFLAGFETLEADAGFVAEVPDGWS